MVGSGTNAPIFASDFFEKETPVESNERFAGRLAMALDFDRDSRVFEFSHSATLQIAPGSSSTPKRKTVWKDGQWVSETGTNGTHPMLVLGVHCADRLSSSREQIFVQCRSFDSFQIRMN